MSTSRNTTISLTLEQEILNQLTALVPNLTPAQRQQISRTIATQTSPSLINNVDITSNRQINTIPQNAYGTINPVDLKNSNLSPTSLTNVLDNVVNNEVSPTITKELTNLLNSQLNINVPRNTRNNLNINQVVNDFSRNIPNSLSGIINTALSGFASGVFNNTQEAGVTVPSNLYGDFSSEEALDSVTEQFNLSTANKYLSEAEKFDINNPENQQKLQVLEEGFNDPTATYPTKEYADLPETNKLAQGEQRGTIVQKKNLQRMTGAKLPGGEAWDQPKSPYKGEYPYNKVTETESGHIIEVDDTPGAERLHIYHKSGTFIEIDVNGSIVKRSVGSSYEIIDKNGKIAISGRADISINGACNIYVGNDANIEVDGDTNITCHNDITAQAGGTFNLSAVEEFNITSKKIFMEAYETMDIKSNESLQIFSNNKFHIKSTTDMYVQANDYYHKTVNHYIQGENLYHKHDNVYLEASSDIHIQGSSFNVDADPIHLNSGTSTSSKDSKQANIALPSNIGIISGRKDIIKVDLEDPISATLVDQFSLALEEQSSDVKETRGVKDRIVLGGFATAQDYDRPPTVLSSETPTSSQTTVVLGDDDLKKATQLPGNYNLSPNFTLEMLSSKTSLSKYFVQASENITYGEIVYNLQQVALNILEPAYNTFPKLIVTSGYRTPQSSSKTSQHILGKAVDIQFQGASKDSYFDYAQKLALILNFDQMLLEYTSYTNSPWIHISFSGKNNRKQIMTFWNNARHSDGLTQLV